MDIHSKSVQGDFDLPIANIRHTSRPHHYRNAVEGTGLGLPLTKALAEANRTHFEIASEPGKGTTVEITFPTTRVLAA